MERIHEGCKEVDGEQRPQPTVCALRTADTPTHVVGVRVIHVATVQLRGDGRVLGAVVEVGEKVHHALAVVADVFVLPLAVLGVDDWSREEEAGMTTAAGGKTRPT